MINANLNINGASRGKPYPTAGLQVIVYNQTYEEEGTTYLRTSIGVGIPKVSGTGLDTIWDFSVLNDARFDKGSYVGNAYGLPEYYDYPFVNIYYDDTSEATRYHWKLTDFHYANLLAQSLLLDNQFFLKAKATTETSNEISEVYQLNIYESEQIGAALTKLKIWMRIAPDFYGDELFEDYPYTELPKLNNIIPTAVGDSTILSIDNGNIKITMSFVTRYYIIIQWLHALSSSNKYKISGYAYKNNITSFSHVWDIRNLEGVVFYDIPQTDNWEYFEFIINNSNSIQFRNGFGNINDYFFLLKELSCKRYYENYYKP